MPSIVESAVIDDAPQIDGRRWITEHHIDDQGVVHLVGPYLADAEYDAEADLAAHATLIEERLANAVDDAQAAHQAHITAVAEQLKAMDLSARVALVHQLDPAEIEAALQAAQGGG
jgi:hypothetical protein